MSATATAWARRDEALTLDLADRFTFAVLHGETMLDTVAYEVRGLHLPGVNPDEVETLVTERVQTQAAVAAA